MARPGKKEGLRYIEPHRGKDGKIRYYWRVGKGTRIPMPPVADGVDPKTDPTFMAAYAVLLNEHRGHSVPAHMLPTTPARPVVMRVAASSLAAALARYYQHSTFQTLAEDTSSRHRNTLNRFAKKYGAAPVADMDHEVIQEAIRPLAPWPQRHLVTALRRFVQWARATGEMSTNGADPTLGLALHALPKIVGHQPWTDKQHEQFTRCWAVGTRQRLAYEIMHRLGLRRSDARRLGSQHVTNGWLRFQPRKTSRSTGVWLDQPMDRELARIIAATKVTGAKTFLVNEYGRTFCISAFAKFMRRAYDAAGLPDCRNHGLRKNMMLELVEAEVKPHDIMALSGHSTMDQ